MKSQSRSESDDVILGIATATDKPEYGTASEATTGNDATDKLSPDKLSRPHNFLFDADYETRAVTSRRDASIETIAVTIASLESLAETIPAILQVANGWSPAGTAFRNRDALVSAVDMLRRYYRERVEREHLVDRKTCDDALAEAERKGIALGIEQEKQRVKEARRGRNKH